MTSSNGSRPESNHGSPQDGDAPSTCRWQDSLALHALGSLAPAEIPGLLEHVASGCAVCVAEHARLAETLAIMDVCEAQDAAAPPTPRAGLRAQLLREIERSPPQHFERPWQQLKTAPAQTVGGGLMTVHSGKEGFERTGIEGIEVKPLYVDAAQRRVTMLVKMAPGTSYPSHRHAASEECFVVSGEIRVGDRTLYAGDYQVAPKGSLHGVQSTERGCVLFIVSSQDDELV